MQYLKPQQQRFLTLRDLLEQTKDCDSDNLISVSEFNNYITMSFLRQERTEQFYPLVGIDILPIAKEIQVSAIYHNEKPHLTIGDFRSFAADLSDTDDALDFELTYDSISIGWYVYFDCISILNGEIVLS